MHIRGGAGRVGTKSIPVPNPIRVLKIFPYPPYTRLLYFKPVPIGAGRGGLPDQPTKLPSLFIPTIPRHPWSCLIHVPQLYHLRLTPTILAPPLSVSVHHPTTHSFVDSTVFVYGVQFSNLMIWVLLSVVGLSWSGLSFHLGLNF